MAKLHVAQIEYLSQQLIDQIKNANNLIVRSKVEIDHAQRTLRILLAVYDEWIVEKELDYNIMIDVNNGKR